MDEIFRTPNTTLDQDDSMDDFATPIGDFSLMKMKSMNNLLDGIDGSGSKSHTPLHDGHNMSRMKSMGNLEKDFGDTPLDLVKLKQDFETKRFNRVRMNSMTNLDKAKDCDEIDGGRRHHSDNGPSPEPLLADNRRLTPRKRVGNTKYIGADSTEENNYQLMKMRSMSTITDIVNNNGKWSKDYDPFWRASGGGGKDVRKYDRTYIVPIKLEERLTEVNGNANRKDVEVFKIPGDNQMLVLRKEKSSSCIDNMRNRGSSLYERLR